MFESPQQGEGVSELTLRLSNRPRIKTSLQVEEERILSLQKADYLQHPGAVDGLLSRLSRPNASVTLYDSQKSALLAIAHKGGGVCMLGVGQGKTFVSFLAPAVLGLSKGVVVVPSKVLEQTSSKLLEFRKHYNVPALEVMGYGALQSREGERGLATLLSRNIEGRRLCLVLDEAHFLKNTKAARSQRVVRVVTALRQRGVMVHVVVMSGTLASKVEHARHLFELALGQSSPLPVVASMAKEWGEVFDWHPEPPPQGAYLPVVSFLRRADSTFSITLPPKERQSRARKVFAQHLHSSEGVVVVSSPVCNATVYVHLVRTWKGFSPQLAELCKEIKATKEVPLGRLCGEDLAPEESVVILPSLSEVARTLSQLALGFVYRWDGFGEDKARWIAARNQWMRMVRFELDRSSRPSYDTELNVRNAVLRRIKKGEPVRGGTDQELRSSLQDWLEVKDLEAPARVPVWIDDGPLRTAVLQARKLKECVLWYRHESVLHRLVELGVNGYASSDPLPANVGAGEVCALSIRGHAVGLDLQHLSTSVVLEPSSSDETAEQLFGRHIRAGQQSDEINFYWPAYTPFLAKKFQVARERAKATQDATESAQAILRSEVVEVRW